MLSKVRDVDTIVTRTEVEALLLESNFIKQYRPPYNVVLRDDKQYLFIKVSLGEKWPRVETVRRITDPSARHFGPYTSAAAVKSSLKTLRKVFPYCLPNDPCDDKSRRRPCLYFNLGLCPSPQYGHISTEDYRAQIGELLSFLGGNARAVTNKLRDEMREAAIRHRYEQAARLRDKLRSLESLQQEQQAVDTKPSHRDVVGLARDAGHAVVTLLVIREGRIVARKHFDFWGTGGSADTEILDSFLGQYYKVATDLPREVLLPMKVTNARLVETFLTERRESKVRVSSPSRGDLRKLLELATNNAENFLGHLRQEWIEDTARTEGASEELAKTLDLKEAPIRIECYDISTLTGTSTVGSMVVFKGGKPLKSDYRRFQIRHVRGIDDVAAIREVLTRRFRRIASKDSQLDSDSSFATLPNLIIIDGGKGQVGAAGQVMGELGLTDVPLIGLAKRLEEIVIEEPDTGNYRVMTLPPDSHALYLLQRVRDEAHRFAITYNRAMRSKRGIRSALDELPGIGPVRKRQLLRKFGSVTGIKQAPLPEIEAVVGKAAGRVVKENL